MRKLVYEEEPTDHARPVVAVKDSTKKIFAGRPGEAVEAWIRSYESMWRLNDLANPAEAAGHTDNKKIAAMGQNMTEDALIWLENLAAFPQMYAAWKALLLQRFGDAKSPNEKICALLDVYQEPSETIRDFIIRMRSIGSAYSLPDLVIQTAIQANCLICYRKYKTLWKGRDFEDWQNKAEAYEAMLEDQLRREYLLHASQGSSDHH